MTTLIIKKSKNNPYDLEEAASTLGIDIESMLTLAEEYIDSIQNDLNILLTSINSNDYDQIRSTSHKIKGTSANLRMDYISEIAALMEKSARERTALNYGSLYYGLHDLFDMTSKQLEAFKNNT